VREGAGHRQEKADLLRHYGVESGGGGRSLLSLCATMLKRTGKWTDWGQVVRNQSEISLIQREGWEGLLG
jgi:hypothetical protein